MRLRLLGLMTLLLLTGCGDSLTKMVNAKFPPITVDEQRQAAINSTAQALAKLATPNIGVGLSMSDATAALLTEQLKKQGVVKLSLRGDEQLLRVSVDFARQFSKEDAGDNQAAIAALGALKPRIEGTITAYAGITGAIAQAGTSGPELELRLLPALSSVHVEKIELADKVDVTLVGTAITAVLNRFKDNISGELTRSPVTRVTVPALSDKSFNPSDTFSVIDAGGKASVEVIAKPIVVPFKVDGIAWLVAKEHLTSLVQLSPVSVVATAQSVEVKPTFGGIQDRVNEIVEQVFEVPSPEGTWVAVKRDVIALAMNSVTSQAQLCVKASVSVPNQHTSTKIKLPNGLGINCSSDRVCKSDRQCSFNANRDTRDCSACLLRAPRVCAFGGCVGGQCTLRGNDPFCEAAKAAQNVIYDADANLRKADCDRLRETENATCEVEKAGEKLLCEAKKEALNRLAATGNFANLDVDSRFATDNLQVCLRDFNLSPALDRVQFALEVHGEAKADVDVKFVPLDIVGHLTCQFPWSQSKSFTASLRESRVGIASNIQLATDTGDARANFVVDNVDIKAKLKPGPTEFLLSSPELLLKCPVLAGIAPTVVALTPFVPQLKGEIDYTLKDQRASVKLAVPKQVVGEVAMVIKVVPTKEAIVAMASRTNP